MFTEKSEVRIYIPKLLHKADEAVIVKEFSDNHGVPYGNIKILSNEVQNISTNVENQIKEASKGGDGNIDLYADYLKDKDYDKNLFQQIDSEISLEANFLFKERSNYRLKYISAYNLTSYGEIILDFELYFGTVGIFSTPSNFGGKSNIYKLIQILLWGKYLSLDEYSVLPNLFNNYLKDDHAYIEGTLELNDKHYFIRREFKKETKKRVKHDLFTYEISNENHADKYIYPFNGLIKEINANQYNPSLPDGVWVKSMNKNELDHFYDAIGKIEDFVKICLFNQSTLYNLILTKKTERTRNFYSLFGGEYYEKKKDIAKAKYSEFKKKSFLHKEDISKLQDELSTNENLLKNYEGELKLLAEELSILENTIRVLDEEKGQKYAKLLPIEPFDIEKKEKERREIELGIDLLQSVCSDLEEKLKQNKNLERYDPEQLKEKHTNLVAELSLVAENPILRDDITLLDNKILKLNNERELLIQEINKINLSKNEIRQTFDGNTSKINFYNDELAGLPNDIKCGECGSFVISYKDKRQTFIDTIGVLKKNNDDLKKRAKDLVRQEADVSLNRKMLEENIVKVKDEIAVKSNAIEQELKQRKNALTTEIKNVDQILQEVIAFSNEKENLKHKQATLQNKRSELQRLANEITFFQKNNEFKISHNNAIKNELAELERKIREKKDILSFHIEKRGALSANLLTCKKNIEHISNKISSFEDEVKLDKAYKFYIETHDMEGIVKYMIESYLPIINRELEALTEHMDFKVEIFLDQGKYINYNFIRDGKTRDLKNVSGCESYIALTALYLVHIKFSKISLPNIVLFDEVFQISDENVENLYEILKLYGEIFDHVFMIWHGNGLENLVDHQIFIEKKDNISRIAQ